MNRIIVLYSVSFLLLVEVPHIHSEIILDCQACARLDQVFQHAPLSRKRIDGFKTIFGLRRFTEIPEPTQDRIESSILSFLLKAFQDSEVDSLA